MGNIDREIQKRLELERQQAADRQRQAQLDAQRHITDQQAQEQQRLQDIKRRQQEALSEVHRLGLVGKLEQFRASVWGGKGKIEVERRTIQHSYSSKPSEDLPEAYVRLRYEYPCLEWDTPPSSFSRAYINKIETYSSPGKGAHVGKASMDVFIGVRVENGVTQVALNDFWQWNDPNNLDELVINYGVDAINRGITPQVREQLAREDIRRNVPFHRRMGI